MAFINLSMAIAAFVFSAMGMVRAISAHKSGGVIAFGAIGLCLSVVGLFVGFVLSFIAAICGAISCSMCDKEEKLTYEQFKAKQAEERAAYEDPEYAAYLARFESGDDAPATPVPPVHEAPQVPAEPAPRPTISEQEFARLNLKLKHGTLTDEEQEKYFDYVRQKNGSDRDRVDSATRSTSANNSTRDMSAGEVAGVVCVTAIAVVLAMLFASGTISLPFNQDIGVNHTSTVEDVGTILMRSRPSVLTIK